MIRHSSTLGADRFAMPVASKPAIQRLRVTLRGAVQGVGFRPFVYRLATEMNLTGWVLNSSAGLVVEVEGPADQLAIFEKRIDEERPRASVVTVHESDWIAAEGSTRFEIHASDTDSGKTVNILPDLATCAECGDELLDPSNRRFHYPFTNSPIAARASRSWSTFHTIGRILPCAPSRSARSVARNTKILPTGVFMRSRMPAQSAGQDSMEPSSKLPMPCAKA